MKSSVKYLVSFVIILIYILLALGSETLNRPHIIIEMDIDGYSAKHDLTGESYVIMHKNPEVSLYNLQFLEFANYLHKVLLNKGYVQATSDTTADLYVLLNYGISDTVVNRESIPIYQNERISKRVPTKLKTDDGKDTTVMRRVFEDRQVLVGFQDVENLSYFGFMQIECLDGKMYREHNEFREMWTMTAITQVNVNDIRLLFPYLLMGSYEYIGNSTGQRIFKRVSNHSQRYKWLMGELDNKK